MTAKNPVSEKTTNAVDSLRITFGQLSALAWLLTDFRGDYEIEPETLRQIGFLMERLVTEGEGTVNTIEEGKA